MSVERDLKLELSLNAFTLEQKLYRKEFALEDIGDLVPTKVMMQDLAEMKNLYMNRAGADWLRYSPEELEAMGPDYYKTFFEPEENKWHLETMKSIITGTDPHRVFSFAQKVRPDRTEPFTQFLSSCMLLRNPEGGPATRVVNLSIEVGSFGTFSRKLKRIIEEEDFARKHYELFLSLSVREKQIIALLANGEPLQTVADALFLSSHTVATHRKNIYRKLSIKKTSQLIKFALAFDLI